MGKVQCNLFLPEELIRQMKHRAIDEQMGLSDWVARAAQESLWLSEQGGDASKEKTMNKKPEIELMPIVHVKDMMASVAFFESLGGKLVTGSRDGDWSEIAFGSAALGLLAHPANQGEESVELAFRCDGSLKVLQVQLEASGTLIRQGASDEAFGEQLQLADPDGRTIKVNRIEPMFIE